MAKAREAPPPQDIPECKGCNVCGVVDDRRLFLLGYNKMYYCSDCWFADPGSHWPKPMARQQRKEL